MARRRATRKWEVFAGRNRFWCDGRLMTAPQPGVFALTLALIVSTCALHFAFDCPFLAAKVSPAVPAAGALLAALTLSALLRTALSDPGILPRAGPGEAAAQAAAAGEEPPGAAAAARPPPRAREVLVRGRPVKLKYCFTCKMFRPPRASHCSLCDNCVERFDHHCPWVGNCVGKRNYRHFYTFVVSLAFLCVFVFACAVAHLAMLAKAGGLATALRASPASAIVAAICFLAVWSVLGLAGFHTYLASTDQTTNEDIKGSFSVRRGGDNPYSRGNPCANCWHVLCGPLPPSLLDRRGELQPELPPAFALPAPPAAPLVAPPVARLPPQPPQELGGSYTNLYEGGDGGAGGGGGGGGAHRHAYMNHSLDLDLQEVCIGGTGVTGSPASAAGAGGTQAGFAAGAGGAQASFAAGSGGAQASFAAGAGGAQASFAAGAGGAQTSFAAGAGGTQAGFAAGAGGGLSAARLRMLLDTTMIDAALDLDDPDLPPAAPAAPPAPALELRAL